MPAVDIAWFGHDDTPLPSITQESKLVWKHRLDTLITTALLVTGHLLVPRDVACNSWCLKAV